jgi:hypothetical protein
MMPRARSRFFSDTKLPCPHAEGDAVAVKALVVLLEEILRLFAVQVFPGLEHIGGQGRGLHARQGGQLLHRPAVGVGAGGRAEQQRIREDGGAQSPGDLRFRGHALLPVHLQHDGGGAAHGLVAEEDGADGLHAADAVVVDDLQDVGLLKAVHTLVFLVVVHQDELLALQVQQVPAGDHAAVRPVPVQHGGSRRAAPGP